MSKIVKIVDFSNHRTYAVVVVQLDDGMEAKVYVGGEVETYFDEAHHTIKAFVKKRKG